jgi:hypothetical protein
MVGRGVPEALTRPLLFLGLVFAALALVPAGAHLAELANKIDLPREEYLAVQQIYRGWALFGVVVLGALLSTGALALIRRRWPALLAFLCIAGTQVVFWTFTYPANRATENWTVLPENWLALRAQWEYSHAASAVLNLVALLALAWLAAREDKPNG